MRVTLTCGAILAAVALFAGCGVVGGYDPADPVSMKVVAGTDLNNYSGGPQSLDLYFARVNEPMTYEGSDISELRVTKDVNIPGGRHIKRFTVAPGETVTIELGAMVYEHFKSIGVFAAYGAPAEESGAQVRSVEIPSSGKLQLLLGANSIVKLVEDDD
jgi:predicted component of type VI protein secretion system